jgi:hypothetical protein
MMLHVIKPSGNASPFVFQQVCEARINEGTAHLIEQNRAEFESILARAMQPSPQKVCASSVYVEHVITYVQMLIRLLYYRVLIFSHNYCFSLPACSSLYVWLISWVGCIKPLAPNIIDV